MTAEIKSVGAQVPEPVTQTEPATLPEPVTQGAVDALDGTVMLLAPGQARIVAASRAARTLLGLRGGDALAHTLDAAMPAVACLRRIAAAAHAQGARPGTPYRERLVFWTPDGAVARDAEIVCLDPECLRVTLDPAPSRTSASPTIAPSPTGRPDALLAAIAARIRDGMDRRDATRRAPSAFPSAPSGDDASQAQVTPPAELATALARLGHELRTPLAAVAAMAEIVRDQRLGPDAAERYREYAGNIHDSARHALALVSALLDPATAAGHDEPTPTFSEVDVARLLRGCLDTIAPLADQAGLKIAIAEAPRLPHVVADERALRQIVLNLMTNALKFTPRGGRITVTTGHAADGPLLITIADTGLGMSEDELAHLRRAMSRDTIDAGAPRAGGGRGIGLPMVRRLAAQSGGRIEISSVLGRGTSVSLSFDKSRLVPI